MNKKLVAIFISVILAVSVLAGCGASFSKIKMDKFKQETDYIVYSNGGNAVQYGDMVYFINGAVDFTDSDVMQNKWNGIVKGALYRAKLLGEKSGRDWNIKADETTELEFASRWDNLYADVVSDEEYTDEELAELKTNIVEVELVAPKVIGTSGYAKGGVFIYDNYIYYATPHNSKNKQGQIQTNYTDFMRTKVDGSKTELIFTTEGDSANQPYAFYKQGGSVILVCYYDTTIVSVKMTEKRIEKPMKLADNATSVLFSVRDTYDAANNITNDPEDFIYFTRAVGDDGLNSGNVVIASRPDGSESFTAISTGQTIALEALKDGGLFYSWSSGSAAKVEFTNLHASLMESSPSYKAYEQTKDKDSDEELKRPRIDISGIKVYSGTSTQFETFTSRYYIRIGLFSGECAMIAFTASGVWYHSSLRNYVIANEAAEMHFIDNNYLYYNRSGGTAVFKTSIDIPASEKSESDYVQVTKDTVVTSGFKTDIVAGYIVYYARIDEWADGYAYFRKVTVEGGEDIQVYQRNAADVKPDDEDDD